MIERYSRKEMSSLWSLENKYSTWLQVEKAVAFAWHSVGRIPKEDFIHIEQFSIIDVDRILAIEEETKHDLIAFITYLEESLGTSAKYIHYGCTSSDIVDTANALLIRQAGSLLIKDIDILLSTLKDRILDSKECIMMGRTHGVHAEPTTFALKMTSFYAEFQRDRVRLEQALLNLCVGKISGAVGTYAFVSPQIEELACSYLTLHRDSISTQIIQRDRYAEFFTTTAIIAGTIERLCVELRHLQRTEIRELEESFSKGQKGSSAMPHKKNPISAENITGISRVIRSNAFTALENMVLWHERDISHSSAERIILPDTTVLLDYALTRITSVLSSLVLNKENIKENINASFGLFFSQRVLHILIEKNISRQKAYELVQKYAMHSWDTKQYFPTLIQNAPEFQEIFSKEELSTIFDISYYIKYQDEILSRFF
ncbi:MAG: adenylosuccinate lyase [Desulfovibrionaceae bacterium]